MTPEKRYMEWRRTRSDVGCAFARMLAVDPERYGQRVVTLPGSTASGLAARIDEAVTKNLAAGEVVALTVVLPELTELSVLVGIAKALPPANGWRWRNWNEPDTRAGAMVAFGLVRDVPFAGGGTVPSEALFLGSFEVFPPTRRAPVTALEIFVGAPCLHDPKSGEPTTKANLAHINVTPPLTDKQRGMVWSISERMRRTSLGLGAPPDDDRRAKAKVAFVVPLALAQSLGCEP